MIQMVVTVAINVGASKPPRVPFTVGLPVLLGLDIQSCQPSTAVAEGVDDLEVPQVEDLAVHLRGMTGDHHFPRNVRLGNAVSYRLPPQGRCCLLAHREIRFVAGVDEYVTLGFVKIKAAIEELEMGVPWMSERKRPGP